MSDLVKRLRNWMAQDNYRSPVPALVREAADEIERLRAAAKDLIDDVLARHPGEELKCPKMMSCKRVSTFP